MSSLLFYAWAGLADTVIFLFVVAFSWLSTFLARRFPKFKHTFLTCGIVVMLLHLFFWKYASWVSSQLQLAFPDFLDGRTLSLPLPVGISFFTLQGVAYLIDYRRGEAAYISIGKFTLFKSFFPQLVAGPIVRVKQLLPQLEKLSTPSWNDLSEGLALFALGFFQKIALADRISPVVDQVFANPGAYNRGPLILGVVGYTVQIWADFSGYTSMGRGAARMLGINLPHNFLSPYFARSPSEFWARWHITLSTWIRDYIYIPLGGNRGGLLKTVSVVLLTMSISGLWHGANWNFLLWGWYHGVLLTAQRLFGWRTNKQQQPNLLSSVFSCLVMLSLTMFGWLIFRIEHVSQLPVYLEGIYGAQDRAALHVPYAYQNISLAFLACMLIQALLYRNLSTGADVVRPRFKALIERGRESYSLGFISGVAVAAALVLTAVWQSENAIRAFIYFQF